MALANLFLLALNICTIKGFRSNVVTFFVTLGDKTMTIMEETQVISETRLVLGCGMFCRD